MTKHTDIEDDEEFVEPYVEHGSKAGLVRKITVSIPRHVLQLLSDERTRRQVNNLRHATNSDLLCEAFLHAFTGQPLPTDEELRRMPPAAATESEHAPVPKPVRKTPVRKKSTTKSPSARARARRTAKR